jgi:hypothetical protein
MYLLQDVRTRKSDISRYLKCWLDRYAESHGKESGAPLSKDEESKAVRELCTDLYGDLSILDSKSNGLIASNAITTAVFSLLALSSSLLGPGGLIQSAALLLLMLSIVALMLNVSVLYVYWSTTDDISHVRGSVRVEKLIRLRNRRTRRYRIAFLVHFAVLGALLILVLALLMGIA